MKLEHESRDLEKREKALFKKETQRRFRSSKASNQLLSPWTPLIPSLILSETSLRIASVSLSVATNQIAKVLFCFEIY